MTQASGSPTANTPRALAQAGEPEGGAEDLIRLAEAVEARRKNSAPPDYEEVRRDPAFWADLMGFWR